MAAQLPLHELFASAFGPHVFLHMHIHLHKHRTTWFFRLFVCFWILLTIKYLYVDLFRSYLNGHLPPTWVDRCDVWGQGSSLHPVLLNRCILPVTMPITLILLSSFTKWLQSWSTMCVCVCVCARCACTNEANVFLGVWGCAAPCLGQSSRSTATHLTPVAPRGSVIPTWLLTSASASWRAPPTA